MIQPEKEMIGASVGLVSLVGIYGKPPYPFGNYFDFASGERCLNMWAENMKHYAAQNNILELECVVFGDDRSRYAIVVDKRIPKEWLHDGLCVTGRGWSSRKLCESVCEYVGVSTNDRICGCEKPDESPHIGQHHHDNTCENVCYHCKRRWPNEEFNKRRRTSPNRSSEAE